MNFSKSRALFGLAAIAFVVAIGCVFFAIVTPVVPPTTQTILVPTIKEIGGNGGLLVGANFLAGAAGFAAVMMAILGFNANDR